MPTPRYEKHHISAWFTSLIAIIIALIMAGLAWRQVVRYEEGILDIYAIQQDGYVQVVLNQINLLTNNDDTKIVEDIIGTLDSSSNKYWTLSKMEALIFVKDIRESNKYKGFSTKSYYATDSAMLFIDRLSENRVSHERIIIDGKRYIASGVQFEFGAKNYRICLLTSEDVVLDHNAYLRARVTVTILAVLLLLLFILFVSALSRRVEEYYAHICGVQEENQSLRTVVEKLNHQISTDNLYDTRHVSFQLSALPMLIEKMNETQVYPLYVGVLQFFTNKERDAYLVKSQVTLDKSVFRFKVDEKHIMLIFVATPLTLEQLHDVIGANYRVKIVAERQLDEKPDRELKDIIKELLEEYGE